MASPIPLVKFQHIENARTKLGTLRAFLAEVGQSDAEWVALEKVDGANFQFFTDGGSISCASRSRVLGESDLFHDYQTLREQYTKPVMSAYRAVRDYALEDYTVVRLYGEIFGGKYPQPKNHLHKQRSDNKLAVCKAEKHTSWEVPGSNTTTETDTSGKRHSYQPVETLIRADETGADNTPMVASLSELTLACNATASECNTSVFGQEAETTLVATNVTSGYIGSGGCSQIEHKTLVVGSADESAATSSASRIHGAEAGIGGAYNSAPRGEDVPPSSGPRDDDVPPSSAPRGDDVPPSSAPSGYDVPPSSAPSGEDVPPSSTPSGDDVPPSSAPNVDDIRTSSVGEMATQSVASSANGSVPSCSASSGVAVSKPVQSRVWYLPHVDFYLFDVSYETSDHRHLYLDIDHVVDLAAKCGFTHVSSPLHRGSLDELLALEPAFPTSIPATVGLEPLANNLAEGYVLRLAKNILLQRDGKLQTSSLRYKLKQAAFEESASGAAKRQIKEKVRARQTHAKGKDAQIQLTEPQQVLLVEMLAGFTQNRVISILSKHEQQQNQPTNQKRLAAMLVDDVLEELNCDRDDLCDLMTSLGKDAMRKVKSAAFVDAVRCVEVGENRTDN